MRKVLIVFGTRPEAIKMAPLVRAFQGKPELFDTRVCVTAQHREMLDHVLRFFEIVPDYDLDLMRPGQDLYHITSSVIAGLKPVLEDFKPHLVAVHGDTTTSSMAALAAFYSGAKVCHIEAGLRTYNKYSPFPEEMNRQLTTRLSDIHFAPTSEGKNNLLKEGVNEDHIAVTGNTVIDALLLGKEKLKGYEDDEIRFLKELITPGKKLVVVTGHRRENFGEGFLEICKAIKQLALRDDVQFVYPVHLNPNVQKPVRELLGDLHNVLLIEPLGYPGFLWLMTQSYFILTDSGGIQEEAPSLGKPVLVMRDTTERPEALKSGTVKLVGTDPDLIFREASMLLDNEEAYSKMSRSHNPYGDGTACVKILQFLSSVQTGID
ncbi:MAG TPA: UDP-N-acetylglucosamine 2-epimerase (non-hydrolyzing) [Sphingobacteriaceae bacterium]